MAILFEVFIYWVQVLVE